MSLPEISRRCLSCGASVRAGARFCPQCGQRFVEEGAGEPAAAADGQGSAQGTPAGEQSRPRDTVGPAPVAGGLPWGSPAAPAAPPPAGAGEESGGLRATRETVAPTRGTVTPTRETAAPPQPFAGGGQTSPGSHVSGARVTSGVPAPPTTDGGTGDGPQASGAALPRDASAAEGEGAAGRHRRAAARVKETVMPRVEKMRDEALVALEETPDDSGLRFVVIAVALFGLFLLFLFLSITVLR